MKIGLFTSGYQRCSLEDAFKDAKKFGYDYIELWGGRPHAYAPDLKRYGTDHIEKLIKKYDIPILVYTPEHNGYEYNFMIGPEYQRRDSIEYLKTCMDIGKKLGAKFTMCSPGHAGYIVSDEEIKNRLNKSIKELAGYAQEIDHVLIVEALTPYESNTLTRANELKTLLDEINSDYVVGMCDVVPPYVQNENIMGYFYKLGDKMKHLHIVDSDGISDTHYLPGFGDIPLKELLEEIKYIGWDEQMTIELVTAYMNEPSLYASKSIKTIREMIEN